MCVSTAVTVTQTPFQVAKREETVKKDLPVRALDRDCRLLLEAGALRRRDHASRGLCAARPEGSDVYKKFELSSFTTRARGA